LALLDVVAGFSPRSSNEERGLKPATTYSRVALFFGVTVMAVAALALLLYLNERTVGFGAAEQVTPPRYFLTETRVVFTYMRLLVFPWPQSLEYEFQNAGGFLSVIGVTAI